MLTRLGAVAVGLCLSVALVVGAELTLRAFDVGGDAPRHDPFAGFGSSVPMFELVQEDGHPPVYRISPARLTPRESTPTPADGREFAAVRTPSSFRIFVVGGSSAAGIPYPPRYAFPARLQARLRAALPHRDVEVVNAALSGYASRRLLPIVSELTRYEPDLLVVYAGHNEWAERRYYAHLIDMDPRLFRLWERAVDSRVYRVLAPTFGLRPFADPEVLNLDAAKNARQMFLVLQNRAGGEQYPSERDLAYRDLLYEHNLREMADIMGRAGARTLFVALSQNFSDWAPGASQHRTDLGTEAREQWETVYASGKRSAALHDCPAAIEAFGAALEIDAEFAELHFRLAGCHRALHDLEAARRHYRLASDLDRVPHGAPTHFNAIIRKVAREHDALVVDADAALAAESGAGLVGHDLFVDWLHPNLRAHRLIADALADALRREGIPEASDRWREAEGSDPSLPAGDSTDPSLRRRETEMRMLSCLLALRDACVTEAAETLLAQDPKHRLALEALKRSTPGG